MSRILRINGSIADIDSTTKINLSYRSPIFGDLQKLTTNTSLTIKLPLSAANRLLIKNVNVAGVQSAFPYDYFRVDYEDNGLLIINNGVGYLLAISDKIEISVIFGGVSAFSKIKDAKLNEMPIDVAQGQIDWDGSQFAGVVPRSDIMFLQMDYGMGVAGSTDYAHPVVRVPKIISWINDAYGLNLATLGRGLVVPCVTKKRRVNIPYVFTQFGRYSTTDGIKDVALRGAGVTKGSFIMKDPSAGTGLGGSLVQAYCIDDSKLRISVVAEPGGFTPLIGVEKDGVVEWHEQDSSKNDDLIIEIPKNVIFRFFLKSSIAIASFCFNLDMGDDELTRGEKFDTLYNLPAIKVVDFIKAIMHIEGKFPQLTDSGIGWVSVDDIYSRIADAVDWSDKLNKVVSQDFKLAGYAQTNTVTWAEDDTVALVDEGVILVENKALEETKAMIKLPFAASDSVETSYGSFARVPIYIKEIDKDGVESIEYEEITPRIIEEASSVGVFPCGSFTSKMNLSSEDGIIARRYSKYSAVVKRPRTLKCEILPTTLDIASLDLMRPVFFEQLHGYFAVLNVTTKDEVADVELLKL